jgi:hypothetical protein
MPHIHVHGLIDTAVPGQVRGRELAREAVTSAVYSIPQSAAAGIGTATAEALAPLLLGQDNGPLIGFIVEMRAWAEIAIQLAADGHDVPVETIVETIIRAIEKAEAT